VQAEVPERVVVVGGNIAGLRTVQGLRRDGFAGSIMLVSAEKHVPYNRPPLSKAVLSGEATAESTALVDGAALEVLGLDLRLGTQATGLHLGRREVLTAGEPVPFDNLVIATGTRPRHLPALETVEGVHVLRTLDDAVALRAAFERGPRVLVIGAGFIGSEVASTARTCGLEVTVVEALASPLAHIVGDDMAAFLASLHGDGGTNLRLETTVDALDGAGRVERAVLSDGSTIDVDVVVVGIGVVPNTEWLAGSGIELADGVVCDATLRAGVYGIYAAGDIAAWPNELLGRSGRVEHWTTAADHGGHIARVIASGEVTRFVDSGYVWSDQYGARLQLVGVPRDHDEVRIVDGDVASRRFVAWYRRGDVLVGALASSSPKLLLRTRRLIEERVSWEQALASLV